MKSILRNILYRPSIASRVTRLLAKIHHLSYARLGAFASASEGGLHPKHRLMKYHTFFVGSVSEGESVLDIGSGNGELLKDIIIKTGAPAVGIELSESNVEKARKALADFPKTEIVHSDIWKYNGHKHFDIIILSNVLEHFDTRVELLQHLSKTFSPGKILIRVPMFEREWLVPYKKELGIEWRLDNTHFTEYTEAEFRDEIAAAGLAIKDIIFKWGEMYAVVAPITKA